MNINDYKLFSNYYSNTNAPERNKSSSLLKSTILILIIISIVIFTTVTYIKKFTTILDNQTNSYLSEVSNQSVNSVKKQIQGDMAIITTLSTYIGEEESFNLDKILNIFNKESKKNNIKRMGIILPNGTAYTSDGYVGNFSDREYFKKALKGITNVSDTLIDKIDGEEIIVYSTPLYQNGNIIGAIFATNNVNIYKNILSVSSFSGEGFSYISKSNGKTIIESNNKNANPKTYNIFNSPSDIIFKDETSLKAMMNNMKNNKNGLLKYKILGQDTFMNYTSIGINDWYLMSVVPSHVVTSNFNTLTKITLYASIFIMTILIALLIYIIFMQKRSKKYLTYLAFTDKLTGFGNYNEFISNSKNILSSRKNNYVYILFDIDNFKYINDVFGFGEGNRILCHIADVLNNSLEKDEIFARKTNDYFAVIMKYTTNEAIKSRLENLNSMFTTMYDSSTLKYNLVINYGVYKITKSDTSLDAISDRANIALKTVKGGHRSCIAFYNDEVRSKILKEREIENTMYSALENKEFQVYLQPKYGLDNNKIVSAEALIRWIHPTHGVIPPMDFIPIFEKNGFIVKLDMYIFNEVCIKLKEWIDNGITPIPISVNQSRVNLHNPSFIKNLKSIISKYNIPSNLIEIEVTESAVFNNVDHLISVMNELKSIGFSLSLDDFGSGYSSLNLLKDIPVDILKLDREFFNETSNAKHSKIVVSSIVNMAKSLNIKVVCEGVETKDQADFLREISCDMAQGYLFAKPMTIHDFEEKAFNQ